MHEVFDHTADLGLRVRASSLNELFADAASGLFSMIVPNLDDVRPVLERSIELESAELDYLLFDWLSELLYLFESEGLLFNSFDARVDGARLQAVCRGEPADPSRHDLDHEVKAITYHGLKVEKTDDGWLAELIVDI